MKRKVITLLLIVPFLTSCFDNGVTNQGKEAHFLDDLDVTWLSVDGKDYLHLDNFSNEALKLKSTFISSFNGNDHYSYKIYELNDYPGILCVNFISVVNIVNALSMFVYEGNDYVPAFLMEDFPHHDTFFNGGLEKKINGITYVFYGYGGSDFEVGEKLPYTLESRACYTIPNEKDWIAVSSKNSGPDNYDFYYRQDSVTSLPVRIAVAGSPKIL